MEDLKGSGPKTQNVYFPFNRTNHYIDLIKYSKFLCVAEGVKICGSYFLGHT